MGGWCRGGIKIIVIDIEKWHFNWFSVGELCGHFSKVEGRDLMVIHLTITIHRWCAIRGWYMRSALCISYIRLLVCPCQFKLFGKQSICVGMRLRWTFGQTKGAMNIVRNWIESGLVVLCKQIISWNILCIISCSTIQEWKDHSMNLMFYTFSVF